MCTQSVSWNYAELGSRACLTELCRVLVLIPTLLPTTKSDSLLHFKRHTPHLPRALSSTQSHHSGGCTSETLGNTLDICGIDGILFETRFQRGAVRFYPTNIDLNTK